MRGGLRREGAGKLGLLPLAAGPALGFFFVLDQHRSDFLLLGGWQILCPTAVSLFCCLPGSFPSFCTWTVTVALLGVGAKNLTPRLASPPGSTVLSTTHLHLIVYVPSPGLTVWSRDSVVCRLISVSDYGYSMFAMGDDGRWEE